MSFQLASKNKYQYSRTDVLGKLVPDRGGRDDESAVAH